MGIRRVLAVLAALMLAGAATHAVVAQDVTIYRCVDAKGHVSLRDTPCAKNEKQEARTMVRPRDAVRKPPSVTAHAPEPEPELEAEPHAHAYAAPPRPLYECITPDDVTYTSDTGDGNPRWVPNWTLGYPVFPTFPRSVGPGPRPIGGANVSVQGRHGNVSAGVTAGTTIVAPAYFAPAYGGQWIQDTCYELPPSEVCDRTRDRRDEVRRRFFNAMPSERDVLRVEERSLNARLDADCGGG
jgi:hypothetical protein